VFAEKPIGKRPFGRPVCRWEDNITVNLGERGLECDTWICVAQDRDQWWTV